MIDSMHLDPFPAVEYDASWRELCLNRLISAICRLYNIPDRRSVSKRCL